MFSISKKSGLFGLKFLNLNIDNIKFKKNIDVRNHVTPLDVIHDVLYLFKASEQNKEEVTSLYDKIKNKSSKINRSRPRSVANAVIFYWIKQKEKEISLSSFAKRVDMSALTINRLVKEIDKIIKSEERNDTNNSR